MKKIQKIISCMMAMLITFSTLPVYAQETSNSENVAIHTNADEIFVSLNGDDKNEGTIEKPFKTIAHARDTVRTMNDDMKRDIVVYIDGGIYIQDETLEFSQEDSGTNGHMITYKAYGDEPAILSGGRRVEGWELANPDKGIYKATFTDAPAGFDTRQIYVNGNRATRARGNLPGGTFDKEKGI